MKKIIMILSLIFSFTIVFSLISCNGEIQENPEKSEEITEIKKSREIKDVNYVIYADGEYQGAADMLSQIAKGKQIDIVSANQKNFNVTQLQKSHLDETVPSTQTFTVDKKDYTFEYSKTVETVSVSTERLKDFSQYNVYMQNGGLYAEYNTSTKELLMFANVGLDVSNEGNLTNDEAQKKAAEVISELYGRDTLNEYVVTLCESGIGTVHTYVFVYTRYIHGLPTSDDIEVTLNMLGEVYSVNATTKGSLKNAEKHLYKEEVDKALAFYYETFTTTEWSNSKPKLTVDANGDYYLASMVSKGNTTHQIYINLQ